MEWYKNPEAKKKRSETFKKKYMIKFGDFLNTLVLCDCGCGTKLKIKNIHRWIGLPRFVAGHQNKVFHPLKGKNHSLNSIKLMSQNRKNKGLWKGLRLGHTQTQEWKINHSNKLKGKKHTKETKRKIGETNRLHGTYLKNAEILKRNNISKFVRNPSKPQLELFKQKQIEYGGDKVFCNFSVKKENGGNYYLDVAVPSLMLNFEYDNEFWHSFREKEDKIRDEYLKNLGWEVIRIKGKQ